jgi:XTP/dITP diphosphohydrolase
MKIIFATNNKGKLNEINKIFAEYGLCAVSPQEVGIAFDATETGNTFADNAMEKAVQCAAMLKEKAFVLADDSGLCVDALDGEPGVHSALWMGADTPYDVRNKHMLERLKNIPDEKRTARFVCVIASVAPDGTATVTEGKIEGRIARQAKGENGFGYDPIFFIPELNRTAAELTLEEKNRISHRGLALRKSIAALLDL